MLPSFGFAAGTLALLLVARQALHRLFGGDRGDRNPARAISEAGEVLGVFLVAAAAAGGCRHGDDVAADAARVAAFGLAGLLLVVVAGRLGVDVLLRGRLTEEIARGNTAAGVVAAGHLVATAVIASGLFFGDDYGTLGIACVFFVVAQASLHLLVLGFRAVTTYDDVEQVLDENLAAALSYAGVTVAAGILVRHAADGPYVGFLVSLKEYGLALLFGLALYPIRQVLVQWVILGARPAFRGGRLDVGIGRERDIGMGALEASTYVATALMVGSIS